jgi:hypothetical protein
MDLSDEHYHAIAAALTEGQGAFSEEEFALACREIAESLVKGEFATLVLEGKLSIKNNGGELKYETSARGRADLEDLLAERGISAEQLREELRRES